jgi:PAS domain S-box-containing protein
MSMKKTTAQLVLELEEQLHNLSSSTPFQVAERVEMALLRYDQIAQAILDNTTAVVYAKDVGGRYLLINRLYEQLFHVTKAQVLGKTDFEFFPKPAAEAFRANDRQVLQLKAPMEFEETAPHDDGEHTYISLKFPLFDNGGAVYAVCGISTDITERKRSDRELRRAYQELEMRVRARTRDLITANTQLQEEIARLKRLQGEA